LLKNKKTIINLFRDKEQIFLQTKDHSKLIKAEWNPIFCFFWEKKLKQLQIPRNCQELVSEQVNLSKDISDLYRKNVFVF
jgi:hypothetical protein